MLAQRVVWRCWCRRLPCSPSTSCCPDAATAWREQRTAILNHFPLRCWPPAMPLARAFAFRALLRAQVASQWLLPQILLGTVLTRSWQYGSELDYNQLVLFKPRRMVGASRSSAGGQTDRARQARCPLLTTPLSCPLSWQQWSASLRRPGPQLTPSFAQIDWTMRMATLSTPSCSRTRCGAPRARRERERSYVPARGRSCVAAQQSRGAACAGGGVRQSSRARSLRARPDACGAHAMPRAAAVVTIALRELWIFDVRLLVEVDACART